MAADTILHRLQANAKSQPNSPAYYEKINGSWKTTTWREYDGLVRQVGRALITLGVEVGDIVTILGLNRSEWTLMDLGAMAIGGAAAGIYASNSPEECKYIIEHGKSKILLVENQAQWDKIAEVRDDMAGLEHIILMNGTDIDDDMTMSWEAFLAKGDETEESVYDARMDALEMGQLATLIYTSGTTGPPKGVMLSHKNLSWTAKASSSLLNFDNNESSISYLPLSHIAEQMFTIHTPITNGYPVYYAVYDKKTGIPDLLGLLTEIRPTVFFGVPRVWERFYNGVTGKLSQAEGIKAKLAGWALGVGKQVTDLRNQGKEPSGLLAMQHNLADKLVLSKVREGLGFDRLKVAVTGAAPVAKDILDLFGSLGITILEVYGQSEDSGPTTFNQPGRTKFGSVGLPVPGTEVKIAEDGEILAKGPHVFMGYLHNQKSTDSTLIDGWLQSGDLGEFDSEGFLNITGRKKDIIITSGGKNIAPKNIEGALSTIPMVSSAIVIGEKQRFLTALITLEPEAAARFAKENGISEEGMHANEKVRAHLEAEIESKCNKHFARVEHVRNFTVLPNDFSVAGGELTPTFKIKRAVVNKMYEDEIEKMYS